MHDDYRALLIAEEHSMCLLVRGENVYKFDVVLVLLTIGSCCALILILRQIQCPPPKSAAINVGLKSETYRRLLRRRTIAISSMISPLRRSLNNSDF
jgi:hypothetical protein